MAAHELILGGARSGKSRLAEARAARWLATAGHHALLLATAWPGDAEMAARIARHRSDRARRLPALQVLEVQEVQELQEGAAAGSAGLAAAIVVHSAPARLLVVDCLGLWLTQLAMPLAGPPATAEQVQAACSELLAAIASVPGPVLLVSNEIGLGVLPLGAATRGFVDALGGLHQTVAAVCERVTLVVAGCELAVKGAAR